MCDSTKKPKKPKIVIGLEIECEFNPESISFDVGEYHDSKKFNELWNCEEDSSIQNQKFYGSDGDCTGECRDSCNCLSDFQDNTAVYDYCNCECNCMLDLCLSEYCNCDCSCIGDIDREDYCNCEFDCYQDWETEYKYIDDKTELFRDNQIKPYTDYLESECQDCFSENPENHNQTCQEYHGYCQDCFDNDYQNHNGDCQHYSGYCTDCSVDSYNCECICDCGGGSALCEFTTIPFEYTPNKLREVLENFKTEVFQDCDFDKIINFNPSMGNHIHISLWEEIDTIYSNSVEGEKRDINFSYQNLLSLREKTKSIMSELGKAQYNRSYAQEYKTLESFPNIDNGSFCRSRTMEVNFQTGDKNHIEFRSFNCNGVNSWQEFIDLYIDGIAILADEVQNHRKPERQKSEIEVFSKLIKTQNFTYHSTDASNRINLYLDSYNVTQRNNHIITYRETETLENHMVPIRTRQAMQNVVIAL